MSRLEDLFAFHLRATGLPTPVRELAFASPRRWRFDFAWPAAMVAIEIDGGTWTNGRHNRGGGIEGDAEKACAAAVAGWRVLRVTGCMVRDGRALEWARRALQEDRGEENAA